MPATHGVSKNHRGTGAIGQSQVCDGRLVKYEWGGRYIGVCVCVCVYVCGGMSTVCVVHCTVAGRWDQEQYKVVPHGYGIDRMQVVYSRERKCLAAWVASA